MASDQSQPFTIAEYAFYLSAVVSTIRELEQVAHSPHSFLESVRHHLEYPYQISPQVSVSIGDDTSAIDRVALEKMQAAVAAQVLGRST